MIYRVKFQNFEDTYAVDLNFIQIGDFIGYSGHFWQQVVELEDNIIIAEKTGIFPKFPISASNIEAKGDIIVVHVR